jgi:hypothetical protein
MYSHTGEGSVSVINTSSIELDGRIERSGTCQVDDIVDPAGKFPK